MTTLLLTEGQQRRLKTSYLGHIDVEVEGEVAAAQHRQVGLVGAVLAHPGHVDGEHRIDGVQHRHRHVEALHANACGLRMLAIIEV